MNKDKGVVFTPTTANAKGRKRIFRHQLAEVHVGLGSSALGSLFYRGGVNDKPSGGDFGSYFADELGELTLSNAVPDFKDFRADVVDLVLTKPLLVHHRSKVAEALRTRLVYGATSLSAFAKLTYFLCKDLEMQFLPFVGPLGTALIASLSSDKNRLVQDPTLIKTVFLVLAGWVKVLSPLIKGKADLLTLLKPLLATLAHRSTDIGRLAGEAMSIAVRKLTQDKGILSSVIQAALDVTRPHIEQVEASNHKSDAVAMDRAVAGVSSLLFECIKGVNNKWHSRFDFFLSVISSMLTPDSNILHVAVNGMILNASKHANPASALELVDALANLATTSLKAHERSKTASLLSYITLLSKKTKLLGTEMIRYLKTFVENNTANLVSSAKDSLADDHNQSIPTCLHAVTSFSLAFAKHTLMAEPLKAIMSEVIELDVPVDVLCENMVQLATLPMFASSLRKNAVNAVQKKCETFTPGTEQQLLLLTISLYEESQDTLTPACAKVVVHALKTEQPQSVKWLAWKLASLLPTASATKVKPMALKVLSSDESVIIKSFALRLLHAVKAKETSSLTLAALQAHPLSPSIAMAGATIFTELEPPKEVREPCLAMLRCGKPNVRLYGSRILRAMASEDSHAAAMIDHAQRGEQLRADLMEENREKVLCFDKLVTILKHHKPSTEDIELGASILFGALNIRFRPLWAKAQEGLQAIAEEKMDVFWPLFTKQLNSYEESGRDGTKIRRRRGRQEDSDDEDDEDEKDEDDEQGSEGEGGGEGSDDESEASEEEAGVSDVTQSIESLWEGAQEEEVSNEDAVTVQSQFKTLWELVERLPAHLISKYCEAIFNEYEKQCSTDKTFKLKRDEVVSAFLKVLVKQTKPDELTIAKRYRENLWGLLADANTNIQRLALSGLKHFKDLQKLGKYEEQLLSLLPHKGLKNNLLNFDFESVKSEDVQLATFRLLRPKLWQNTNNTRHQVLSFICESNEVQFERFVEHIVVPIIQSNSLFNKRAAKILEFIGSVIDGLGARIEGWLSRICMCVMSHLEGSYGVTGKGSRAHREARRTCLKLFTKVFKQFPEHAFADELIDRLCTVLKEPIADLGNAASSMGSLLSLLAALAEDESLIPILKRLNALRSLTEVLGQKNVSIDVYVSVLSILDSVIETDATMFSECCPAFVKGVHFATLNTFKGDNKAFAATVNTLNNASAHLIEYADKHKDGAEFLNGLMSFLIDCLRDRKLKPPKEAVSTCTNVLCSVLPKLPNIRHLELVNRLALLFYVIRHDGARYKVAVALQSIIETVPDLPSEQSLFLKGTAQLICSTNALLKDGNYDFDTRISAFYTCAEHFDAWGKKRKKKGSKTEDKEDTAEKEDKEDDDDDAEVEEAPVGAINFGKLDLAALRPVFMLPLAYNLSYFVANAHQSIRTTAALALKAVIVALKRCQTKQGTKEVYEQVICPVVVHGVRVGVKLADPLVRNEWMLVYGRAALSFNITPGLCNINSDFDFYANITHPQTSRKLKALATFRQFSHDLAESSMESIFIPYFLKLLQQWSMDRNKEGEELTQSESGKFHAQTQALLVTFSHIATHLSWSRYHRLVMLLLKQEVTSNHLEKSITNCIMKVLECFHFLPTQEIKPVYADDEEDHEEEVGEKQGDAAKARIGDVLVEKIIPAVHRFWKGANKKEDGEEKMSLVRAPLAVTILNLLKFIPADVDFGGVVDSILTELVAKLKTKKAPQRETVREVLGDALGVLGPSFLKKIIHLLRATLIHGYQLHVMGYTTVTMLNKVAQCEGVTEHINSALDVTVDTLMDDYIGVGGTEKEVEELAKTMKEVKKNRALEGMELVATLATPDLFLNNIVNRVQKMFTPTEKVKRAYRPEEQKFNKGKRKTMEDGEDMDVVDTNTGLELLSKVKTMLRRCARGVCRNKSSDIDRLVDYSSVTIMTNAEHRDKFMEQFEIKQSSVKVRLTGSSMVEDISKIRAAQKKDHEVQLEPERRDRGFEKREVNSQKRQLGSARRKGVQESKRRIVIPGAAARRTLQSMECIDELVVSIAWSLVHNRAEDTKEGEKTIEKVSKLVEPLVEVMGGDASDSVVTLALLVLHEVLKSQHVKAEGETVASLMDLSFQVVERQGEIRSACFRLMSVLLLHRQAELNESQAMVCCSLIRTDLDKKNTFMIPALHLLKAIVIRRIEVAEVYDIMPVVQEKMLHHSASIIVSQLSGSIIARFLTDWKMTEKKLHSHIDYVIQNLQYPVPTGRLALLGLLEVMLQRFPDALLKKEVEYFFIPLAHRLMADEDRAVRRRTAGVLATLYKLSADALENIVKILVNWLGGEAALQITALQALNVFLKETPELSASKIGFFYPEILLDLTTPANLEVSGVGAGTRRRKVYKYHKQNWEVPYHATIALEAVLTHHAAAVKKGEDFDRLWDNVHTNLTHSHPWVRTASSRIFGSELIQNEDVKRGKLITAARSFVQQINDLAKTEKQTEEEITSGLGAELETDIDTTVITMGIKNLTWLLPKIANHQDAAKGSKDVAGILREVKEAALAGNKPEMSVFKNMSPQKFFKEFGTVRSGAVVKLVGVVLVKMYGKKEEEEEVKAKKKPVGSRTRRNMAKKRKQEREDQEDEEEEEEAASPATDQDPVFEQITGLIFFLYACLTVPLDGSPLKKLAKEVLDVLKHSLTSQSFVKLFHKQVSLWKEVNIKKQEQKSFKSAGKGRKLVKVAVKKDSKMLPTTDGGKAKAGSRKRAFSGPPPKKRVVKKARK